MTEAGRQRKRTWVESYLRRDLPEFANRCIRLLAEGMNTGVYNINCRWDRAELHEGYCRFVVNAELATYDFDRLTRLVIGAHDECIRVSIDAVAPRYMEILMHPRERNGDGIARRHPTIEDAVARYRDNEPPQATDTRSEQ